MSFPGLTVLASVHRPVRAVSAVSPPPFARWADPPFWSQDEATPATLPNFVITHPSSSFIELISEFVLSLRESANHSGIGSFALEGRCSEFFWLHVRVSVRHPLSFCCNHVHQLWLEQVPQRIVWVLNEERSLSIRSATNPCSVEVVSDRNRSPSFPGD